MCICRGDLLLRIKPHRFSVFKWTYLCNHNLASVSPNYTYIHPYTESATHSHKRYGALSPAHLSFLPGDCLSLILPGLTALLINSFALERCRVPCIMPQLTPANM